MTIDFYNDMRTDVSSGRHYKVEVVADTRSEQTGQRITTMSVKYPRYIHAQMLTHRMFSRNAQSSRAIPTRILMEEVERFPVMPIRWGKNQPGMVASAEVSAADALTASSAWKEASQDALMHARTMIDAGIHKEVVNRLLEPFTTITAIFTATEWSNFFALRCEDDAQPEIQKVATMMAEAMASSDPVTSRYHLPYVMREEYDATELRQMFKISSARCARVSYLTHEGSRDFLADLALADRLASSGHWSPWEHPAMASETKTFSANFRGWSSARNLRTKTFSGDFRGWCSDRDSGVRDV